MDDRNNPLINAARGRNACGLNHDELLGPLEVEIKELKEENEKLRDLLLDAQLQIEYLHGKFQETGTGNAVISRIKNALNQ